METKRRRYVLEIISVFILIIGTWLLTWYIGYNVDYSNRGTFGDMFGSINALFSGLALAGIIFTFFLQREDLKITRKDLEQTRKEFEIQNKTLHYQRFEATLFNLLSLHQKVVDGLYYKSEDEISVKGRNVFRKVYETNREKISSNTFDYNECDLEHYFRNIYRIIKFIDTSVFHEGTEKEKEEKKYQNVKFLREQLSIYEQILIYYWGISDKGEKIHPYIEKFTFLKNIPESFINNSIENKLYDNQAFIVKEDYRK